MKSNVSTFEEFVNKVNEDSMQIMYSMRFMLTALMKEKMITFKEQVTQEDVNNIYEYFTKSFMAGDSLIDSIKVKLIKDPYDLQFTFSSTSSDEKIAIEEFCTMLNKLLQDICSNFEANCEKEQNKIKKFIDNHYE